MRKGYTLIELLVVISIMGIIFLAGYVGFREFSWRQGLIALARSVRADLRWAQQKANSGEKPTTCDNTTVLDGYEFKITPSTAYSINAVCSPGPVSYSARSITLSSNYTIDANNTSPAVMFKVLGQGALISSLADTTITLTQISTGKTATVTITKGGEIK